MRGCGNGELILVNGKAAGEGLLERGDEYVVRAGDVHAAVDAGVIQGLDLAYGKHALQRAHEDERGNMATSVATALRSRNHALLHVIVDHRARDELLARKGHEREVLGHEGEHLVEIELYARHLLDSRDVDARHALAQIANVILVQSHRRPPCLNSQFPRVQWVNVRPTQLVTQVYTLSK